MSFISIIAAFYTSERFIFRTNVGILCVSNLRKLISPHIYNKHLCMWVMLCLVYSNYYLSPQVILWYMIYRPPSCWAREIAHQKASRSLIYELISCGRAGRRSNGRTLSIKTILTCLI